MTKLIKDTKKLSIGEILKVCRLFVLKTSQSEVSKNVKVSAQTICNIEKSTDDPVIIRYLRLLREKNVDINLLLDGNINDLLIEEEKKQKITY